jgi:hypothetical protein
MQWFAPTVEEVGRKGEVEPTILAIVDEGGLEEISEHIAAAFDAVNDLAKEMAPLAEGITRIDASLAAINRRLEGVGRVGPVLTDLAAWMAGVVARQDKVEAELVRLGDEVQAYRRRMQLKARPPLLSDDQAGSIVNKVLDGLAELAAQQRAKQAQQAELETVPPPEPERKRRHRRR